MFGFLTDLHDDDFDEAAFNESMDHELAEYGVDVNLDSETPAEAPVEAPVEIPAVRSCYLSYY